MACSTTGSFDVRTGANVKYQRESHTLLKDRDVQMSWNGELTSASARPIGGNILIKIREEKGQTTSGLFLGLEAADKALKRGRRCAHLLCLNLEACRSTRIKLEEGRGGYYVHIDDLAVVTS